MHYSVRVRVAHPFSLICQGCGQILFSAQIFFFSQIYLAEYVKITFTPLYKHTHTRTVSDQGVSKTGKTEI